jgi:hypothetical protein
MVPLQRRDGSFRSTSSATWGLHPSNISVTPYKQEKNRVCIDSHHPVAWVRSGGTVKVDVSPYRAHFQSLPIEASFCCGTQRSTGFVHLQ